MAARALMIAGTGSDVGKSLLVAGLARAFHKRGLKVRPFKPQNMSNNAAVTVDGGEIGRAQALQARAAGVEPEVHMNPVLLKPQSDIGSQLIVQGKMIGSAKAAEYQTMKAGLMEPVLESFSLLAMSTDLVLVEGAGSVSEVNLRANDIANFGFARATGVPVVLVADIDRGGVIASLAGTKVVIDPADAALIRGFIVNKFRGDPALFAEGMTTIAKHTGWTPLGLVPYFEAAAKLPAEDALGLERPLPGKGRARTKIAVLAYPRISNFDDFDPLRLEPHVDLVFVKPGQSIPADASLVILPGSKSTIADLKALRESGWHIDLETHVHRGGHVLGVCGGYQMLGTSVADPDGIEGPPVTVPGLGYLDVETCMLGEKQLYEVDAESADGDIPFRGYEMHVGESVGEGTRRPFLHIHSRPDGAVSADGRISGCYVHGLFAGNRHRAHWLSKIGARTSALNYEDEIEATLDALAAHLERHIDCDALLALAQVPAINIPIRTPA